MSIGDFTGDGNASTATGLNYVEGLVVVEVVLVVEVDVVDFVDVVVVVFVALDVVVEVSVLRGFPIGYKPNSICLTTLTDMDAIQGLNMIYN